MFCIFVGVLLEAGGGLNHRHRSALVVVHVVDHHADVVGLLYSPPLGCIRHGWVGFTVVGLYSPWLGCICRHWVGLGFGYAVVGYIHCLWPPPRRCRAPFAVVGSYSPPLMNSTRCGWIEWWLEADRNGKRRKQTTIFIVARFRDALDGPPNTWVPPRISHSPSPPITPSSVNEQAAHIPLGRGGVVAGILRGLGALAIGPTSLKRGEGHHAV